jgi:hypothetical protein
VPDVLPRPGNNPPGTGFVPGLPIGRAPRSSSWSAAFAFPTLISHAATKTTRVGVSYGVSRPL